MAFLAAFSAGAALAWSLAAPPGPGNALMAQETAQRGFLVGWAVGLGAITGDLLMLALTWFGVLRVLDRAPWLHVAVGLAGVALMMYFAWGAWRSARGPVSLATPNHGLAAAHARGVGSGFARGFLLIVTSPFNLGWWISAGTLMIREVGAPGIAGFFVGLLLWVAVWNYVAREGARRIKRFAHYLSYAAAVVLAGFSLILLAWVGEMARALLVS